MMTFFKVLGILAAAVVGVAVLWFVILPVIGFCLGLCWTVLWGLAGILLFVVKIGIFIGLVLFVGFLLLRLIAKGLELILY